MHEIIAGFYPVLLLRCISEKRKKTVRKYGLPMECVWSIYGQRIEKKKSVFNTLGKLHKPQQPMIQDRDFIAGFNVIFSRRCIPLGSCTLNCRLHGSAESYLEK